MTAQLQVLNKILDTKNYSLITTNNLDENYFSSYANEFSFIKNHYERYHTVPDILTFTANFPDFDVIKVTEPERYLLDALFKDHTNNFLAAQFNIIKDKLEHGDTDGALNWYTKAAQEITRLRTSGAVACTDLTADLSRYERYEERCNPTNNLYYKTGFPELDEAIGGIDRENENMVIIARTGIGKTWTALKMAVENCKQGRRVGFYSGEMSTDKVGMRFDTLFAGIDNRKITRGDPGVEIVYHNYIEDMRRDAANKYGNFFVLTPQDLGGAATVNDLANFIAYQKLDILFIDQYSLLEDTSGARAENEKIANISKAIKNLQVMSRIPIISVSQQNRTKSESGEIDTTMVFGSDRIGQDSTVLIAIDKKDTTLANGNTAVVFTLNILKARDGSTFNKISYITDLNTGKFTYIDESNNTVSDAQDTDDEYYDETTPW